MLHKIVKTLAIAVLSTISVAALANGNAPKDLQVVPTKQPIAPIAKPFNHRPSLMQSQEKIDLETKPWSIMFYAGASTKTQLGQLIRGDYTSAHETLYSAELAYTLDKENIVRRVLSRLVGTVQLAGNLGQRTDHIDGVPKSIDSDLYVVFRWIHFPWNNYVTTTLAAGEGISYVSHVPYAESHSASSTDVRRLLNYLMFEATFALPSHPEWQLLARIHHRSTAYGVFGSSNAGSNNIGLGIRYYFNF